MIKAYAAFEPKGELRPFEYDPGVLGAEDVQIKVDYCGICHSDLAMIDNDWGISQYPQVAGHEVIGTVSEIGGGVKHLKVGDRVGLGWFSKACQACEWCESGDANLCQTSESTIVCRAGGFAESVRAHESWVTLLPEGIDLATAGPLFCGGITVFNPIVQLNIKATDRVGVVGIGGLGHMALKFLSAWGCEVTAFTSSASKAAEAIDLGANRTIDSLDEAALKAAANSLDVIIVTAGADLDWGSYINILRPKGRLHFVGVPPSPVASHTFPLITGQKSISASPLGSPSTISKMLDFAKRHSIAPIVEEFPFEKINDAIAHLRSGKARYRVVLKH